MALYCDVQVKENWKACANRVPGMGGKCWKREQNNAIKKVLQKYDLTKEKNIIPGQILLAPFTLILAISRGLGSQEMKLYALMRTPWH